MNIQEALSVTKNIRRACWDKNVYLTTKGGTLQKVEEWTELPFAACKTLKRHKGRTKYTVYTAFFILIEDIMAEDWDVAEVEDIDWVAEETTFDCERCQDTGDLNLNRHERIWDKCPYCDA